MPDNQHGSAEPDVPAPGKDAIRRDKGTDGSLRLGHLIPDELDRVGSMAGVHVGESRIHNVPLLVLVGVDY